MKNRLKSNEDKRYQTFPVDPIKGIVPVAEETSSALPAEVKKKLIELIDKNRMLPPALQRSRFSLLIDAGFPYEKAIKLSNILFDNDGSAIQIKHRGFDSNSAKLTIQEIMHDERASAETRLKAATESLKINGAYKDPEDRGDKTSEILAGVLRDVIDIGKSRSRVPRLNQPEKRIRVQDLHNDD
ncbi:hypothetical protein M0R04_10170 [Candidatus Dojkabacteria bacterium]|jgi:hypothetical protein|nr:hypothetical protein [Candidatus Dojkabacteria bacterium]